MHTQSLYTAYISCPSCPFGPRRAHPCSCVGLTQFPLCDTIAKMSQLLLAWGRERGCQLPRQLTNSSSFRRRRKIRAAVINDSCAQREVRSAAKGPKITWRKVEFILRRPCQDTPRVNAAINDALNDHSGTFISTCRHEDNVYSLNWLLDQREPLGDSSGQGETRYRRHCFAEKYDGNTKCRQTSEQRLFETMATLDRLLPSVPMLAIDDFRCSYRGQVGPITMSLAG